MPPFAALAHHFRDFFQGQVGEALRRFLQRDAAPGRATDQQTAPRPHFLCQRLQLRGREGLRCDVEVVVFAGMAVLPPQGRRRLVGEAFQFRHRFSQHFRVVVGVDDVVAPAVMHNQGRREAVVAETAAALPVHRFADAALVRAVDDLAQAGDNMRMAVLAQLHHDPAPPHLVGNRAGSA